MKTGRLVVINYNLKIQDVGHLWSLFPCTPQQSMEPFFSGHGTIAQILFNVSNKKARKLNRENVNDIIRGLR
jgi:hypothetical protein